MNDIKTNLTQTKCQSITQIKSGIYKILNKVDGKYYVGSSKNIQYRWTEHKRKIGAAGVMRVKAELLARGFDVAEPDVDCGVDLIAWDHRKINRIQVKATVQKTSDTGSHFHVTRLVHKQAKSRSSYDPGEIDFIVCVSIPLNKFWIIPTKDAFGKAKLYMSVGNQYHDKWIFLSQAGREISGDKLESARELRMKLWELKKLNKKLSESIKKLELENEISKHKIYNYYRYLKNHLIGQLLNHSDIINVERYGTIYNWLS